MFFKTRVSLIRVRNYYKIQCKFNREQASFPLIPEGVDEPKEGYQMDEKKILQRITVNPNIFGGKPMFRGRRLAGEHVLAMLAAGDSAETILEGYPWLEKEKYTGMPSLCP
jgi:uncharacterized protein (DUF433 family)